MAKKMSGKGLALFMMDSNLMSMHTLMCASDPIQLDDELKALIYSAIRPILGQRVKSRFDNEVSRETQLEMPIESDPNEPINGDNFSERNPDSQIVEQSEDGSSSDKLHKKRKA